MLKRIYRKYKSLPISDECGGPPIYVLGAAAIFFLLALITTFAYAYKIQHMASMLNNGIKTAAITVLGDTTVSDPDSGGIKVVDVIAAEQEFSTDIQAQLTNWPQSTYTLQSFQVFSEADRGSIPPPGFTQPVPGTSIYLTMNLNLVIHPGFIPINTHWSIPLYVMVSPNSYESSTRAWNLTRGT